MKSLINKKVLLLCGLVVIALIIFGIVMLSSNKQNGGKDKATTLDYVDEIYEIHISGENLNRYEIAFEYYNEETEEYKEAYDILKNEKAITVMEVFDILLLDNNSNEAGCFDTGLEVDIKISDILKNAEGEILLFDGDYEEIEKTIHNNENVKFNTLKMGRFVLLKAVNVEEKEEEPAKEETEEEPAKEETEEEPEKEGTDDEGTDEEETDEEETDEEVADEEVADEKELDKEVEENPEKEETEEEPTKEEKEEKEDEKDDQEKVTEETGKIEIEKPLKELDKKPIKEEILEEEKEEIIKEPIKKPIEEFEKFEGDIILEEKPTFQKIKTLKLYEMTEYYGYKGYFSKDNDTINPKFEELGVELSNDLKIISIVSEYYDVKDGEGIYFICYDTHPPLDSNMADLFPIMRTVPVKIDE